MYQRSLARDLDGCLRLSWAHVGILLRELISLHSQYLRQSCTLYDCALMMPALLLSGLQLSQKRTIQLPTASREHTHMTLRVGLGVLAHQLLPSVPTARTCVRLYLHLLSTPALVPLNTQCFMLSTQISEDILERSELRVAFRGRGASTPSCFSVGSHADRIQIKPSFGGHAEQKCKSVSGVSLSTALIFACSV